MSSASSSSSSSSLSSRLSTVSSTSFSSTFSDASLYHIGLAAVPSPSVSPPPPHHHHHHRHRKAISAEGGDKVVGVEDQITVQSTKEPRKPSKTHSFFASPFSPTPTPTPPPPPPPPPLPEVVQPSPKRSLTASFFAATPQPEIETPSPISTPGHTIPKHKPRTSLSQIPLSRLFPSRYRSDPQAVALDAHLAFSNPTSSPAGRREFLSLDTAPELDDSTLPNPHSPTFSPHHLHPTHYSSSRSISPVTPSSPLSRQFSLSSSEESDNGHDQLGITLPSPRQGGRALADAEETETERTPRPGHLESPFAHHSRPTKPPPERLSRHPGITNVKSAVPAVTPPPPISNQEVEDDLDGVLSPGSVIRSPLPITSPLPHTSSPTPDDEAIQLTLVKPLGQGAFSAVWLAVDESRVGLVDAARAKTELVRRESGRLKRNRSGRSSRKEALSRNGSGRSTNKGSLKRRKKYPGLGVDVEEPGGGLTRSDSGRSTISVASSINSIASLTSTTSLASFDSCATRMSDEVLGDILRVKLGKGGVCGVRPMGDAAFYESYQSGDGKLQHGGDDVREKEIKIGTATGQAVGLGISVGEALDDAPRSMHEYKGYIRQAQTRLVAVKMTPLPRRGVEEKERERMSVSFVREVEVLKHISHPNITPLLSHLTTPTHHVLVLPYLPGGDLLGLVNTEEAHAVLLESVLKEMFYELCKAVAWMHSVGLVHRDIKLENILLATSAFSSPNPASPPTLASLPSPLILLTDFGLSRFIDPANPLLTTRCGSEAYAAPELVMSGGRGSVASKPLRFKISGHDSSMREVHEYDGENEGGYDARETDAWACGVVLFALVCRRLPFGEGAMGIRGEREEGNGGVADRRRWLMKIAKGDYSWPEHHEHSRVIATDHEERELRGMDLVRSEGAKRVVGRLLVRDPSKRLSIGELMRVEEEWVSPVDRGGDEDMGGDGTITTFDSAGGPYAGGHVVALPARAAKPDTPLTFGVELPDDQDQDGQDADGEDEEDGGEEEDDGWLITEPPRDSIVCREVV
ncbi:hypothetical protein PLEOSDRAFT_1110814 [Pleurotus ostreatus PC15]|uniref:non-specific serine/threonine protein kinase n=1 Tax=Pleurotus ostreatus (strain PC15) TaxID=1137138 RepID=A0A067P448_PLEO1|nr:hypothetical protein PLEOSDRAFT_1110814 [Pleurotus ostreatus PC15]